MFFGVYVQTENKESLLTHVDDFGKQSHRTENNKGVATEKYHSDFERFKSDQLLETHTCEEHLQQEALIPNIIGKHLNNKMENSNERLLTEHCACHLTSGFPCSDMEFSSRKKRNILPMKLQ